MPRREKITAADCLRCGACCVAHDGSGDGWAEVELRDERRLPERFVKANVRTLHLTPFQRLTYAISGVEPPAPARIIKTTTRVVRRGPARGCSVDVCAALKGDVMHAVRCSVYEQRPDVCRKAIKPGDSDCRSIRAWIREQYD